MGLMGHVLTGADESYIRKNPSALGASNSPAEEIRIVRNFYVHRGKDTAALVQSHPSFRNRPLNWMSLLSHLAGPGVTRMELWVVRLRSVARAAIQ